MGLPPDQEVQRGIWIKGAGAPAPVEPMEARIVVRGFEVRGYDARQQWDCPWAEPDGGGCPQTNDGQGGAGIRIAWAEAALIDVALRYNTHPLEGGGVYVKDSRLFVSFGAFEHNTSHTDGGGLFAKRSEVVVLESTFAANTAPQGGAIRVRDTEQGRGSLDVDRSRFVDNEALGLQLHEDRKGGGAIAARRLLHLKVRLSRFADNRSEAGPGGAIEAQEVGPVRIQETEFVDNRTLEVPGGPERLSGGAVWLDHSGDLSFGLRFERCRFEGNESDGWGGGAVAVDGGALPDVVATIETSTFDDNHAHGVLAYGGAVRAWGGMLTVHDSTFEGNTALQGGAVRSGSDLVAVDNEFHGNEAQTGGGLYVDADRARVEWTSFSENHATGGAGGARLLADRVRVASSKFVGNTASFSGGGLRLSGGEAELEAVDFEGNTAARGAGLYASHVDVVARGLRFVGNGTWTVTEGGGMRYVGSGAAGPMLQLSDIRFVDNRGIAGGGLDLECGPLWSFGPPGTNPLVLLQDVVFEGNEASYRGGGLRTYGCDVLQAGGGYDGNRTSASAGGGGAIYADEPSNLRLSQLAIHDNQAFDGVGGGILFDGAQLELSNVLLVENQSADAALFLTDPERVRITQTTIAGNHPGGVAPILAEPTSGVRFATPGAHARVEDSVIAFNLHELQLAGDAGVEKAFALAWHPSVSDVDDLGQEMSPWGVVMANPVWQASASGSPNSTSNLFPADPASGPVYYYLPLSGSPLLLASSSGGELGAFGGPGGGWCVDPGQTCVP